MLCLGIETSCDDTSLAFVENGRLVHQESVSQIGVHALFGGVVPEIASREHARSIGLLYDRLLERSGIVASNIDVIAVTRGPGLLGSLLVGVAFAKSLALGLDVPLIGVNHLHAHLMAAGLEKEVPLPAIGLLVSGGHTHLYAINDSNSFEVLGKTLDDAAGEAFDKAGKMLGLPYPAGKIIDDLSCEGNIDTKLFPEAYLDNDNINFSFSGLKTSMNSRMKSLKFTPAVFDAKNKNVIITDAAQKHILCNLCASYTDAIVRSLIEKTRRAIDRFPHISTLILAGGVAANTHLRKSMAELAANSQKLFIVPGNSLCSDNGAMVAYLGELLASQGYYHPLSVQAIPRGQQIPIDYCNNIGLQYDF